MEKKKRSGNIDYWAADRTHMANQRTLLSYIRTSFMLIVSGVSLMKFLPFGDALHIMGILFLPCSIAMLVIGIYLYKQMEKRINDIPAEEETPD